MTDGQLTATIRHLQSSHEARAVPLSPDRVTILGVGWAATMGLPPAEVEVAQAQQALTKFHWDPHIKAAEGRKTGFTGLESEACR